MAPKFKPDTPKRMGLVFTGVLLVAGTTFYIAKRNIAEKRRLDLEEHRASQARAQASETSASKGDSRQHTI
ncbi:hypothetical protein LshimejAT787_1101110 [Lyophyllum shimeji]|uniref:Transmembrane protein n=1 Tax=Lyophyllum shimeji TaxID=47721 RepID=A0A9P3PUV9_LYOSH|nr:hypothetical protein LshimejAT787_1101110 [Lyophyllum shimeji]